MKKLLALLFVAAIAFCADAANAQTNKSKSKSKTKAAKATVIKRGVAIGDSEMVSLADVLATPQNFTGKKVVIEGVIERSCTKMGCWMEIAAAKGGDAVRAETEHKFFLPLDAAGMKIKAEGEFSVKTISKEDADHLESEGGKVKRNEDGTATEISFVATGVELRK